MSSAPAGPGQPPAFALSGVQRLFAFATLLGLAGAALWVGPLHDSARPSAAVSIPWWAELVACYVGGLVTVEVGVRRRFTVSLAEIAAALGLFVVDPWALLGCYTVGVLLAHWTRRGLQPSRDYGNLMLDVVFVGVAVLVFAAAGPSATDPLAQRSLLALGAAMASAGGVLAPAALVASVALYQGRLDLRAAALDFVTQLAGTITSTCVALILLVLTRVNPWLVAAALPPALLVIALQHTAMSARRRAERIAFLHRVTDILGQSTPFIDRGPAMLTSITGAFDVGTAELLLVGGTGSTALRFLVVDSASGVRSSRSELTAAEVEALRLPAEQRIVSARADAGDDRLSPLALDRGLKSCSVLPLRGAERTVGLLILQQDHLPRRDLDDLLAAVSLIGVSAEQHELVTVDRRRGGGGGGQRRARGSAPLTVCDRPAFMDALSAGLSRVEASRRPTALLLVDLDAFLGIRGTYGESVGESVLTEIARRMQRHLRRYDVVGRLGSDQLGILLDALRRKEDAEIVGRRVLEALSRAFDLGGDNVIIGASVGIAVVDDYDNVPPAEELLRRADMAVYLAKRQAGMRCLVFDNASRESVIAAAPSLN